MLIIIVYIKDNNSYNDNNGSDIYTGINNNKGKCEY